MTDLGFLKVATVIPSVRVGDPTHNSSRCAALLNEASQRGAAIALFPELCITGYTCADLFGQPLLIEKAVQTLGEMVIQCASLPIIAVVGIPLAVGNRLYNTAVVFGSGRIYGVVPKSWLPNYNEFYEARWFASGCEPHPSEITLCGECVPFGTDLLFGEGDAQMAIELCEDLWVPAPPSSRHAAAGANILLNLSATNEMVGKHDYLCSLIAQQSARTMSAYIYCSAGFGESSTDLVFAGNGMIAENGIYLAQSERFSLDEQITTADIDLERLLVLRRKTGTFGPQPAGNTYRHVEIPLRRFDPTLIERLFDPHPFTPSDPHTLQQRCEEIFQIQVHGLAQRMRHTGAKSAVIGISGGLDSTLALLVTVRTFDKLGLKRSNILGVTMPGFGTTHRTHHNALRMMELLGVTIREIDIREACTIHFRDIGLDPESRSVTYENSQARERTQLLMDLANLSRGLVIGTGDLSELALGWATYNGDHMSMYGVNSSIPKTLVRFLVRWVADRPENEQARPYLLDIIDTPVSPELLPADAEGQIAQKTEDLVGPYELHDFFLYHFIRFGCRPRKLYFMACRTFDGTFDRATIKRWLQIFLRRFFNQQFKRSALPDGPKVGSVSLSPRGDWRMPSDASSAEWLCEADNL